MTWPAVHWLDVVFVVAVVVSVLVSLWRGLIFELLSVLGWVGAFFVAQWAAPAVAQWVPIADLSATLRYAVSFAVIFIVAAFVGGFIAWWGRRLVEALGLRPVDRVLGMAFGVLRGVVILLAAATLVLMTPMATESWWTQSTGAQWLTAALKGMKPMLPPDFAQHLPV